MARRVRDDGHGERGADTARGYATGRAEAGTTDARRCRMAQARVRSEAEVHVLPRNLRWELSVNGLTRPMLDWFFCKERAVEYAVERAHDVGAKMIVIERQDHSVEEVIDLIEVECTDQPLLRRHT